MKIQIGQRQEVKYLVECRDVYEKTSDSAFWHVWCSFDKAEWAQKAARQRKADVLAAGEDLGEMDDEGNGFPPLGKLISTEHRIIKQTKTVETEIVEDNI